MASILEFGVSMSMLMGGDFNAKVTPAVRKLDELSRKMKGLQKTQGNLKAWQAQATKLKELEERMKSARTESERMKLGEAAETQRRKLDEYTQALNKAGIYTADVARKQQELAQELDRTAKVQDRLARAQEKYSSLRGQLTWGNMKGDVLSSMGALKVLQAPVTVSMNYEQAMSQVKAVLNPTEREYELLREQSLELGRMTQFSAVQAANSQENLARAGFTVDKILAMMPEVLNVAAADGMDLAQAADIVGGNLRGFNLAASEAQRISDILAYTSSNSATNVAMAGAALQGISGTAAVQGITPEQAASYIGVLANRAAVQGTEAATTLERSISALAMRKGDTDKVLNEYRIATKTRTGRMRTLEDVVQELYTKTQSKGPAEMQKAFMGVFGKAYGGDMLKFAAGITSGELAQIQEGLMTRKNGSASKMALTRNDNLRGDLTSLSSAWEGFMESVGNPLQEWSRGIVQEITDALNKITSFIKEHEKLAELVIKIGAGMAAWKVGATVFKYGGLLMRLPFVWLEVQRATRLAEGALSGFAVMQKASTAAQWLWNAAMNANPIGLMITGITALAVGIAWAYHNWDWLKEKAMWVCEVVSKAWNDFVLWWDSWKLTDIFAPIKQYALDAIDWVKAPFVEFYNWLTNLFSGWNPFASWKAPELPTGQIERGKSDIVQKYGTQDLRPSHMRPANNAMGGIYSHPILTWAAEKGAEAIIPLTDKSRGIPLLMQAAQMLGITRNDSQSNTAMTNAQSLTQSHSGIMTTANAFTQSHSAIMTTANAFTQSHSAISQSANDITGNSTLIQQANEIGGVTNAGRYIDVHSIRSNDNVNSSWPSVNLTVNLTGDSQDMSIAEKIKQAVIDALDELTSRRERLSYA